LYACYFSIVRYVILSLLWPKNPRGKAVAVTNISDSRAKPGKKAMVHRVALIWFGSRLKTNAGGCLVGRRKMKRHLLGPENCLIPEQN
jgi:hypothetical protein